RPLPRLQPAARCVARGRRGYYPVPYRAGEPTTDPPHTPAGDGGPPMAEDSTGAGADPPVENLLRADVLKQYEIIVGHLRFEHTAFWTRFGFMLVAQTALLGFFAQALLEHLRTPRPQTLAA